MIRMLLANQFIIRTWTLLLLAAVPFSCARGVIPSTMNTDYSTALTILEDHLEAGGLTGTVQNNTLQFPGFRIELEAPVKLPEGTYFSIEPQRSGSLAISARTEALLVDAAYAYLRNLGYRWFLPNDNWTITPRLTAGDLAGVRLTGAPAYPFADLFPSRSVYPSTAYERWLRRIGIYSVARVELGHYGFYFNRRYEKTIRENPEWLAVVNGKRVAFSKNVKLDYTHPGVIDLMQRDAERRLNALIAAGRQPPYFLSVEPPDEKGYTEAPYVAGSTVSDQVFSLANAVARHLKSLHPQAYASLLAYTNHSTPPDFELEDNVAVVIADGWFQETASMRGLMAMWAQKAETLGIRAYSGVPRNTALQIQFPAPSAPVSVLRDGERYGFEIYQEQTVFSAGALGFRHYLTAALLEDPEANTNQLSDEFFTQSFGAGAGAMRRLFEQSWDGYNHGANFPTTVELIRQAAELAGNDAGVQSRLTDIMAYAVYLDLAARISSKNDVDRIRDVVNYAASISTRKMVDDEQLARHYNVVLRGIAKIPIPNPNKPGPQLTDREIRDRFDRLAVPPAAASTANAQSKPAPTPGQIRKMVDNAGKVLPLRGTVTLYLEDVDRDGYLRVPTAARQSGKAEIFTAYDWFDGQGNLLQADKIVRNAAKGREITLQVTKGGAATLRIHGRGSRFSVTITPEIRYLEGNAVRIDGTFPGGLFFLPGTNRAVQANGGSVAEYRGGAGPGRPLTPSRYLNFDELFDGRAPVLLDNPTGNVRWQGTDRLYFHL